MEYKPVLLKNIHFLFETIRKNNSSNIDNSLLEFNELRNLHAELNNKLYDNT